MTQEFTGESDFQPCTSADGQSASASTRSFIGRDTDVVMVDESVSMDFCNDEAGIPTSLETPLSHGFCSGEVWGGFMLGHATCDVNFDHCDVSRHAFGSRLVYRLTVVSLNSDLTPSPLPLPASGLLLLGGLAVAGSVSLRPRQTA